ncbi:TPA: fimbrial protein [Morganella morganii subsp. morganii]|uniref:Fimbrial protein n=1 Tax=Morganella morganii TaxID=582 RepID=A0AAU8ZLV2_MORMO|nr:fimbrial protein [Morganella morganii]HDU8691304.1 fimbrial protein [Morganella morganii subsp. morganii]AWC93764.1 fimbrial protein [Morganella morganii]EKW8486123.1 fimbrial protein [Morganella morganii]HAT3625424.1 fimbrial protein [Morganella morganii]HCU0877883.1 fimbrial protein [Morganella morganii]
MNKLMIRGAALFFLLMVSQGANAIGWVGAGGKCASGGKNIVQLSGYCDWGANTGAYYGKGQSMNFNVAGSNTGDNKAYVPKSGYYTTKVYWCAYPKTMDTCSKANGFVLLTGDRIWLEQSKSFSQQKIFNHDQAKKSPSAGGYCFTITDDNGYEYRGDMGYGPDNRGKFCGDAHRLPVEPPKCTLNGGADLDVQLGKLERTDIAVKSGTTTPVTRDISIKCDGNIDYNATMKLEFPPISVSNEQVISTSTTGLGVAVLYNGKAIQPGQTFPLSYQPGIHTLTLGFEAVRDPAINATDLKTGDFTANAILVFTEQ